MAKFGVGARVIDLLGKQQVAGTPTAISELFKNAHDAYAKSIDADFYRVRNLLVIRDDGIGMSRIDFETRWLTAATDSKRNNGFILPPDTDLDQKPRPVMGEKGIGRLAIAVLGRQVLVLTRKKTKDNSAPLVAALLHWDIFSLPNIQLNDLDIPVREIAPGSLPDQELVRGMVQEAVENLTGLRSRTDIELIDEIVGDLTSFSAIPASLADVLAAGPDLRGEGHGTHFYITPTNETLSLDIDEGDDDDRATPMQKALLGFCNTMVPGHTPPPMRTTFRDHKGGGLWEDIIGSNEFFSPDEFETADHQVLGSFDEFGQFEGSIKVFGSDPKKLQIHWPNTRGGRTRCGPFELSFAYIQGTQRETSLPRDIWQEMSAKLNKIGGLYLYRDDIRILPYGDSDYDFLNIERRRTKSAGYYFFSYRRMFGVIETSRSQNSKLVEKAGREGFQANAAYKEFQNILENFFIQLAADFFREGGASSDEFVAQKEEYTKNYEILRKRERQISNQRRKLSEDFDKFFGRTNDNYFDVSIRRIVDDLTLKLSLLDMNDVDPAELRKLERDAEVGIQAIAEESKITRPRAIGLTKEQSRQWARYEVERRRLDEQVIRPGLEHVRVLFSNALTLAGLSGAARQLAYEAIADFTSERERRVRRLSSEVRSDIVGFHDRAIQLTRDSIRNVRTAIETKLIEFERNASADMSPEQIASIQTEIESNIQAVAEEQSEVLENLAAYIGSASKTDGSQDRLLAAMESDLEDRRDREEQNLQLAQMGQAIGIVHHEFNSVIRSVRNNVRRLETWAQRNEKFRDLYNEITESYAHLDSYLSLFAPLSRQLAQTKRLISGVEIVNYLEELLGDRMRRHGAKLVATQSFELSQVEAYVSTIFPAFVNLVDNALYWLNHGQHLRTEGAPRIREKIVTLDYVDQQYRVSDTGPGVLPVDELAIFENGFTRKPRGTGLGLSITSSVLDRQGFRLTLAPYRAGSGATFCIDLPDDAIPDETQ